MLPDEPPVEPPVVSPAEVSEPEPDSLPLPAVVSDPVEVDADVVLVVPGAVVPVVVEVAVVLAEESSSAHETRACTRARAMSERMREREAMGVPAR